MNVTVPVGESPLTVAVNVTACPTEEGLVVVTLVVDVAMLTTCESGALVLDG
ncbi:MAG TPA: hypothetical protein VF713_06465 [Thermoanaerobaculia bacterium]